MFYAGIFPFLASNKFSGTYRLDNGLEYPINLARNVAREAANSHWIFPIDNELIPSPRIVPAFLEMIAREEEKKKKDANRRRIFVLPAFDIDKDHEVPRTKTELVRLFNKKVVSPLGNR